MDEGGSQKLYVYLNGEVIAGKVISTNIIFFTFTHNRPPIAKNFYSSHDEQCVGPYSSNTLCLAVDYVAYSHKRGSTFSILSISESLFSDR